MSLDNLLSPQNESLLIELIFKHKKLNCTKRQMSDARHSAWLLKYVPADDPSDREVNSFKAAF